MWKHPNIPTSCLWKHFYSVCRVNKIKPIWSHHKSKHEMFQPPTFKLDCCSRLRAQPWNQNAVVINALDLSEICGRPGRLQKRNHEMEEIWRQMERNKKQVKINFVKPNSSNIIELLISRPSLIFDFTKWLTVAMYGQTHFSLLFHILIVFWQHLLAITFLVDLLRFRPFCFLVLLIVPVFSFLALPSEGLALLTLALAFLVSFISRPSSSPPKPSPPPSGPSQPSSLPLPPSPLPSPSSSPVPGGPPPSPHQHQDQASRWAIPRHGSPGLRHDWTTTLNWMWPKIIITMNGPYNVTIKQ